MNFREMMKKIKQRQAKEKLHPLTFDELCVPLDEVKTLTMSNAVAKQNICNNMEVAEYQCILYYDEYCYNTIQTKINQSINRMCCYRRLYFE